jgi:predicted DNA-binding protein with PD1-like motif
MNWGLNNLTVKSFVICNSGHLLSGVHIEKYEIFVVRANIERREMDAELQLKSEVNGHIDNLDI